MNLKTLSTVAVGMTFVALDSGATEAKPVPSDQFHWSTAIPATNNSTRWQVKYNRKTHVVPDNLGAKPFIEECLSKGNVVRMRGFLDRKGKPEWSQAEFLCAPSIGGAGFPELSGLIDREVRVFGKGPATLRSCELRRWNSKRIWTECGTLVPNDGTSQVLIGNGQNAGRVMKTDDNGSGINTVEPVLLPEVEKMREKIFRGRLESGYYNASV
ncbi:MAG: hypothetical protein NW224_29655 [Leptolyngbyaceae cyanobacterium bins.302]|nr:hypothetical protein [Leptolyngbyaceae cyanobacterium bins.302]